MMWHIAGQGCCTSHCPFGRAMAASQLDKFVALGSVCYCSAHGSYLLRSWAFLVIPDVAHKPSNQTMKPTAPFRENFSVFATTAWISSRCPASLVRFVPSHSRTPAVLLLNANRGLSLCR